MVNWAKCKIAEALQAKSRKVWVFKGTRVPVMMLFKILKGGGNVESFVLQFPTVTKQQAQVAIGYAALTLEIFDEKS
jgi:uncharacterized protein (DUF433 family)